MYSDKSLCKIIILKFANEEKSDSLGIFQSLRENWELINVFRKFVKSIQFFRLTELMNLVSMQTLY